MNDNKEGFHNKNLNELKQKNDQISSHVNEAFVDDSMSLKKSYSTFENENRKELFFLINYL